MSLHFGTVAILGVGLLGGSVGLGLRSRGMVERVRGVGHRQSSLEAALEVGAIDEAYLDIPPAVHDADLVVVCTPAAVIPEMLDVVREHCRSDAAVTDVASTKAEICAHVDATWPKPLRFIGSHPMAGSERFGPEHADPNLYEASATIVVRRDQQDPRAFAQVCGLWRGLGSRVVELPADKHDALLAVTSHIPHIVASCLAQMACEAGDVKDVVGGGFRDMTRIAAARPEVWRDICLTNRPGILDGLEVLSGYIEKARRLVDEGSGDGLAQFFEAGKLARQKVVG
jgi:prephenate dehydrogenase